jgi:hypothetical protein
VNDAELHAKAVIAAALIASHAVEIPAIPKNRSGAIDQAAVRLRELTEYVYQTILGANT